MAKSGIRLWQSAAKTVPVDPAVGKDKFEQPAYLRKATTVATSKKLLKYRSCIREKMSGVTAGSRQEIQKKFTEAAHACKGAK